MTDDISKTIENVIERHREALDLLAEDDGPELKPCPFCGSSYVHLLNSSHSGNEWAVTCKDCNVWVDHMLNAMSREEAIELWNRRVKE